MCMQCAASAMTVVAGASGLRVWLAAKRPAWVTPARLRRVTAAIVVFGVLASGISA